MRATSADIARLAGVSRATVSYVLNETPGQTISEATRESVLRAANELQYRPNAAARSLRSGRGSAVLFPLPGLQRTHVINELTTACQVALEARGMALVVDHTAYRSVDAQLDAWMRHAPAAVIDLLLKHEDPVLDALRERGARVLSAGLGSDSAWESTSDAASRACRVTQLEHLLERGAKHVALVVPVQLATDARVQRRTLAELRSLARRAGAVLEVQRVALTAVGDVVRRWTRTEVPDAVAAFNDDYAIAVLTALTAAGLRVPEDVRLIGVDDVPLAAVVTPSLTTVAGEFHEYAEALAQSVLSSLDGRRGSSHSPAGLPVPTHRLVVRQSTA